jgi:WD40 repeat protein
MYGMVKAKLTDLCDTQLVLGCFYKPSKYCFYTICLKKIKIWNMFNGKLKEVYDNFLPSPHSEITSFCTDLGIKRIYIGDCFGNILNININNGKILKKFDSHNAEIISMCHSTKLNILISLSNDSLIKFHKDKDFEEINTLKEFTLDKMPIKTIKLNETYSRIIIGTTKGELKYFDIEHLRQDSSSGKENEKKIRNEDPINEIYSFEEFPICISFHESSLVNFEIIPPTFYKFRTFGEFNNVINKDGNEIKVKIVSSDFDKVNKRLFTADFFGYVHCYSLKELFDILNNINMINGSNEDSKYIQMLRNFKIEKLFCFEAHKEKIKQIQYPDINPNIIITTGNDLRVKLFSAENGAYIDEFMQSSDNLREYPIGLRYYYSDPFVSKINADEKIKSDTVFRKDIVGFKMNKFNKELLQMKKESKPLNEYLLTLVELNAKERLYLITKNVDLPLDKSSNWKYNPNLEEIMSNEKEYYDFNKKQT